MVRIFEIVWWLGFVKAIFYFCLSSIIIFHVILSSANYRYDGNRHKTITGRRKVCVCVNMAIKVSQSNLNITSLLCCRFSSETVKFLYLLLYSPIGIFIVLLRTLLGLVFIILGNVLPDVSFTRTLLTNLFRAVFGIIVHTENVSNKDNVKVVISNYISPLDHFVVHTATGCILVSI